MIFFAGTGSPVPERGSKIYHPVRRIRVLRLVFRSDRIKYQQFLAAVSLPGFRQYSKAVLTDTQNTVRRIILTVCADCFQCVDSHHIADYKRSSVNCRCTARHIFRLEILSAGVQINETSQLYTVSQKTTLT